MNVNYDELILLAGGTFLTVFGISKLNERKKLLASGIKVEGVVFDLESDSDKDGVTIHPVIRFVTEDKQWITQKYNIGSTLSAYKIGDSVTVIYDAADYSHFLIDNKQTKQLGPVFIGAGIALIIGVIVYFIKNQYPSL